MPVESEGCLICRQANFLISLLNERTVSTCVPAQPPDVTQDRFPYLKERVSRQEFQRRALIRSHYQSMPRRQAPRCLQVVEHGRMSFCVRRIGSCLRMGWAHSDQVAWKERAIIDVPLRKGVGGIAQALQRVLDDHDVCMDTHLALNMRVFGLPSPIRPFSSP